MRLVFLVLLFSAVGLRAETAYLKPADFKPLTSLPWKDGTEPVAGVLDAIYREPDIAIRYPVLAMFLETIPVGELGEAFDGCIKREGTVLPNKLVTFFLGIWAWRDPEACWRRTQGLFHVVAPENDYLTYDSWTQRPVLSVRDLAAVRASPFWLDAGAITVFPEGVSDSALPRKERVRIMREFVSMWFDEFGTWPVSGGIGEQDYSNKADRLMEALSTPLEQLKDALGKPNWFNAEAARQIAARRLVVANPADAPDVIKHYREMKIPTGGATTTPDDQELIPVLMLWADRDEAAMVRWAEGLDPKNDDGLRLEALGLLMPRVDEVTRTRWLDSAKAADKPNENSGEDELGEYGRLVYEWGRWDPASALKAAASVAARNAEILVNVGTSSMLGGPFLGSPNNGLGGAMEALRGFNYESLDDATWKKLVHLEWEETQEGWGEIDPGGSARYGVDFMLRTHYLPKEKMERFFAGDDIYPDEEFVMDRTFCALRSWAVFKPAEMEAWIKTLRDPAMEKALTWLMEHPWGTKPKPGHEL